jgi:hypothetical protein
MRHERRDVLLHGEPTLRRTERRRVRRLAVAAEVEARAEAAPGAGEHHHAHRRVRRDVIQVLVERFDEIRRHGVQHVRPVQRELRDARARGAAVDVSHRRIVA